jgi:hypothetical protein
VALALAKELPGVEEGMAYGTPAFRVKGRFMARLKEDGETLAIRCDFALRERLIATAPKTFFLTDHYLNYPAVLVRLPMVTKRQLKALVQACWEFTAPKSLKAGRGGR